MQFEQNSTFLYKIIYKHYFAIIKTQINYHPQNMLNTREQHVNNRRLARTPEKDAG